MWTVFAEVSKGNHFRVIRFSAANSLAHPYCARLQIFNLNILVKTWHVFSYFMIIRWKTLLVSFATLLLSRLHSRGLSFSCLCADMIRQREASIPPVQHENITYDIHSNNRRGLSKQNIVWHIIQRIVLLGCQEHPTRVNLIVNHVRVILCGNTDGRAKKVTWMHQVYQGKIKGRGKARERERDVLLGSHWSGRTSNARQSYGIQRFHMQTK